MTLHAFIEYLKYKWKAKSRHGIHSPFVYDLIDHVLLDKSPLKKEYLITCPGLELKYENLLCRIATYYSYSSVTYLPGTDARNGHADMLLINAAPNEWMNLLNNHMHLLKNESAVIIASIHKTHAHSDAWGKLIATTNVRMSIDLYGIGLVFFKEEFKEKQHFVLKY